MRPGYRTLAAAFALAVVLAATGSGTASPSPEEIAVRSGSVVRWPGTGIESCEQAGERYAPTGGACWIAIDLEARARSKCRGPRPAVARRGGCASATTPFPPNRSPVSTKNTSPRTRTRSSKPTGKESGRALALRTTFLDGPPFSPPLAELPEGCFGARRIFNGEARSPHGGTDYRAAPGTVVVRSGRRPRRAPAEHYFAGQSVYLDHGDGLISMSFHFSERLVKTGDRVERGQSIGRVGASGRVTGPHPHCAVRLRGARIDLRSSWGRRGSCRRSTERAGAQSQSLRETTRLRPLRLAS